MAFLKEAGKALGGIGVGNSWLSKAISGKNPADAARPYLEKIPGMVDETYNPYIQQGQEAYGQASPVYNEMTQDPTGYINRLMADYSPSEGYKFKAQEMGRALGNTAAAGGYRGGSYDQRQQADLIRGLLGDDMQQFLNQVLGVQNTGLQGQQNIYNTGYGASGARADALGQTYGAMGGLEFKGLQQQNQAKQDFINGLMQLLGAGA